MLTKLGGSLLICYPFWKVLFQQERGKFTLRKKLKILVMCFIRGLFQFEMGKVLVNVMGFTNVFGQGHLLIIQGFAYLTLVSIA